jgi:voltage-gated potassium channel
VRRELLIVGYIVLIVVLLSSALIFHFEKDIQPDKYGKPSDAIWWSFVTLATVGYGDLAPVTLGGRAVAVVTMVIGIGIFGVFVSLIGSAFTHSMKKEEWKHDRRLASEPN